MHKWRRRLVYLPSVGTKTAVRRGLGRDPPPQLYTLTFIPEEGSVRVENHFGNEDNVEIHSLKGLMMTVENILMSEDKYNQGSKINRRRLVRNDKWQSKMRKVKVFERMAGSSKVRTRTLPAYSPMERQVQKVENEIPFHTLTLKPLMSLGPEWFQPDNDDNTMYDKMTSDQIHRHFEKELKGNKYVDQYKDLILRDRSSNPQKYFNEEVYGKEIAENPDSEVYDTDSVIDKGS